MTNIVDLPLWTEEEAKEGDVVLTSRIRLARNLQGYPFPHRCSRQERFNIRDKFKQVVEESPHFEGYVWIDLESLPPLDKHVLIEEHVISIPFSNMAPSGRAVCYDGEKRVALSINEEDHLRLQRVEAGLNLEKAYQGANVLDDAIEEKLDFAFSEEFGYKTSHIANAGCGLRASVMVHIPAIIMSGGLKDLTEYLDHVGLTLRGIFGEGTESSGHVVQISNLHSMGVTEEHIISNLKRIALYIVEKERGLRERMLVETPLKVKDEILRSYAILRSALLLNIDEFMGRFSLLRLGINLKVLPFIPLKVLNQLMITVRPAYLKKLYSIESDEKIDEIRAKVVREKLKEWE